MRVVSNTSPLLIYAKAEFLWVLQALFAEILVPTAVMEEILVKRDKASRAIQAAEWIRPQALHAAPWRGPLDPGDAEAIALAQETKADLLLLDERVGRGIARQAGIQTTGSLGILGQAHRAGLLQNPSADVQTLRNAGLWISDGLVHWFEQSLDRSD